MYTPLYIKTDNSLQQSLIKIPDLIEFAKKNNIESLSITDNNMYGVMDFYKACINNNIKPLIGLEVTYKESKVVLYAINYDGYKNLIKLSTISTEKDIDYEILSKYSNDLVCIVSDLAIYEEIKGFYKYVYIGFKNKLECDSIEYDNKIYINETLYLTKEDSEYIKYVDAIRENVTIDLTSKNHLDNYIRLNDEYNRFM